MLSVAAWAIAGTFTSCSDDADTHEIEKMSSREKAEFIKSQVLDEGDNIYFAASENSVNVYLMPAESSEFAHRFAETLSCTEYWDGKAQTVDLGNGYGNVRMMPGDKDGVFSILVFNVKDIPSFTLELCTPEYFQNENRVATALGVVNICTKCRQPYGFMPPKKCKKCGNDKFERRSNWAR